MFFFLLIGIAVSTLVPQTITLNAYQNDINNIKLSDNGNYVCLTTFGGDAKLLSTDGTLIQEFHRQDKLGEYIVTCTFSPQTRYLVLNSAIQNNDFYSKGWIRLYSIASNRTIISKQTTLRKWGEFPWPNSYAFSDDDCMFALSNYGSTNITLYRICDYEIQYINADTNAITTMIISHDKTLLIWKQDSTGNITLFNLTSNIITIQFYVSRDCVDVMFYANPSVVMDNDGDYLIDASSNNGMMYLIDINNNVSKRLKFPWIGQKISFHNDTILHISILNNMLVAYNPKTNMGTSLINATKFTQLGDFVFVANNNELSGCMFYQGTTFDCPDNFNGKWKFELKQIGLKHLNGIYTIDVNNNLIKWDYQ